MQKVILVISTLIVLLLIFFKCIPDIISTNKELKDYRTKKHNTANESYNNKIKYFKCRIGRRLLAIIFLMIILIFINISIIIECKENIVKIIIYNKVQTYTAEDDYCNPLSYAISANTVKEETEAEKIKILMDELFFSCYVDYKVLAKDNSNEIDNTTKIPTSIIELYDLDEMLAPVTSTPTTTQLDHEKTLQLACEAEERTKKIENESEPDCIITLTNAIEAINNFILCLSYSDLKYETKADIKMRIGIIFHFLYYNLKNLDSFNPYYRIHFLLFSYHCFNIAQSEINSKVDDYWLQAYFYVGECNLRLGKILKEKESSIVMYDIARENFSFVTANKNKFNHSLDIALESDINTLNNLPSNYN